MSPGFTDAGLGRLSSFLEDTVAGGSLAGVLALLWRDGERASVGAGTRDIATGAPLEADSLIRIASMTKPITSVAALMLLEEGRLGLEDPIERWAPEFADMQVLATPDGPLDPCAPARRAITIEDLLTHRSGLGYSFTLPGPLSKAYRATLGDGRTGDMDPDAFLGALGRLPLAFQPGDRFQYGHSTDVLGLVVGRVLGRGFRDVVRERILEPLKMLDTDFFIPPDKAQRTAALHSHHAGLGLERVDYPDAHAPPPFARGCGGLISTANDYLRFSQMLLRGGELEGRRLLDSRTVRLMTTNRLSREQRRIPFQGLPMWRGQGFGLGVSVLLEPELHTGPGRPGAFGWGGAFGTWWRIDPAERLILIYMTQNLVALTAGSAGQAAAGQMSAAQAALPRFQALAYQALAR